MFLSENQVVSESRYQIRQIGCLFSSFRLPCCYCYLVALEHVYTFFKQGLEADGLIIRHEYPQVPPKVEYYLSEKGYSLLPVIRSICKWGHLQLGEPLPSDEE